MSDSQWKIDFDRIGLYFDEPDEDVLSEEEIRSFCDKGIDKMKGVFALMIVGQSVLMVLGLWVSAMLFQYNLWSILGKDVPWYADVVGGIVAPINLVVACGCWIARLAGYSVPFLG